MSPSEPWILIRWYHTSIHLKIAARVLHIAIGVFHQAARWISSHHRHEERINRQRCVRFRRHAPPDDASAPRIHHASEIEEALVSRNVVMSYRHFLFGPSVMKSRSRRSDDGTCACALCVVDGRYFCTYFAWNPHSCMIRKTPCDAQRDEVSDVRT